MVLSLLASPDARGEPYRLRADAYAQAQAQSSVGLLVLQGEDRAKPWLEVEGLAWVGARPDATGDVLTLTVRAHDLRGRGEVRAGRFLLSMGSVRPLHIDGARALGRTPWGTSVEAFGGVPAVARLRDHAYDWAAGGRVAQSIADRAVVGIAYIQRRDRGEILDEEAGADLAASPVKWLDLAGRAAFDVANRGPSDLLGSVAVRVPDWRLEAFVTERAPWRLLPATSLFSVLGGVPSTRAGGTVRWDAAPRLDLLASTAVQIVGGKPGVDATFRANLRTDDDGVGVLGLELRRQGVPGASWSGVRAIGVVPLYEKALRASTELELAAPDDPRGRGDLWPWGLVALSWRSPSGWSLAAAGEAAATSTALSEVTALVRASYALGAP